MMYHWHDTGHCFRIRCAIKLAICDAVHACNPNRDRVLRSFILLHTCLLFEDTQGLLFIQISYFSSITHTITHDCFVLHENNNVCILKWTKEIQSVVIQPLHNVTLYRNSNLEPLLFLKIYIFPQYFSF